MNLRFTFAPFWRLVVVVILGCCSIVPCMGRAKVGVLLKDKSPGFWVFAEKGAVETAATLDMDVIVRAPPSVLDASAQSRLLAGLVAEKLDALIIAPTNPDVIGNAVAELAKGGLKIITVDTPLPDGIAQVFVGADQVAMAAAAAKVFLSFAQDGDEVAMLRNNSLDRTVVIREDTLREAVKARPALTLHANIFASSEKDSEADQARLLLAKFPNSKVVFASATRATLAMINAVREKGLVGKVKIVGFGTYLPEAAMKALEDGILYGWVAQQPKELGVKAVRSAAALIAGQNVPPVVRPDFLLVTQENLHSPEVKALMNP